MNLPEAARKRGYCARERSATYPIQQKIGGGQTLFRTLEADVKLLPIRYESCFSTGRMRTEHTLHLVSIGHTLEILGMYCCH